MISFDHVIQRMADKGNQHLSQLTKDTAEYVSKQRLINELIDTAMGVVKPEKAGIRIGIKYVTSDGKEFDELQNAEWHQVRTDLALKLDSDDNLSFSMREGPSSEDIADWIIKNFDDLKSRLE